MIRHLLLIQFKNHVTEEQIHSVKDLFDAIPHKIPGVEAVEWGINNSPEGLNRGFTHSVLMAFADETARARYLPHPEHDALKEVLVPLIEEIVVFDYQVGSSSA